jgi:hypothetical protein
MVVEWRALKITWCHAPAETLFDTANTEHASALRVGFQPNLVAQQVVFAAAQDVILTVQTDETSGVALSIMGRK